MLTQQCYNPLYKSPKNGTPNFGKPPGARVDSENLASLGQLQDDINSAMVVITNGRAWAETDIPYWTPHPVIVTIGDTRDLLGSSYREGGPPKISQYMVQCWPAPPPPPHPMVWCWYNVPQLPAFWYVAVTLWQQDLHV